MQNLGKNRAKVERCPFFRTVCRQKSNINAKDTHLSECLMVAIWLFPSKSVIHNIRIYIGGDFVRRLRLTKHRLRRFENDLSCLNVIVLSF